MKRHIWVGIGQIGLVVMAIVTVSFAVRRWLGNRTWRLLHYLSFLVYLMVLVHGIGSGTDTDSSFAAATYWGSAISLAVLAYYRVKSSQHARSLERAVQVRVRAG